MRRDEGGAFGDGSGREGASGSDDFGAAATLAGSRVVAGALLDTGGTAASSKRALSHETHDDVPSVA
jgi:hypothetical protein